MSGTAGWIRTTDLLTHRQLLSHRGHARLPRPARYCISMYRSTYRERDELLGMWPGKGQKLTPIQLMDLRKRQTVRVRDCTVSNMTSGISKVTTGATGHCKLIAPRHSKSREGVVMPSTLSLPHGYRITEFDSGHRHFWQPSSRVRRKDFPFPGGFLAVIHCRRTITGGR
jgi:hypothetical protein